MNKVAMMAEMGVVHVLWSKGLYSESTADKITRLTHRDHIFQWRTPKLESIGNVLSFVNTLLIHSTPFSIVVFIYN